MSAPHPLQFVDSSPERSDVDREGRESQLLGRAFRAYVRLPSHVEQATEAVPHFVRDLLLLTRPSGQASTHFPPPPRDFARTRAPKTHPPFPRKDAGLSRAREACAPACRWGWLASHTPASSSLVHTRARRTPTWPAETTQTPVCRAACGEKRVSVKNSRRTSDVLAQECVLPSPRRHGLSPSHAHAGRNSSLEIVLTTVRLNESRAL